MIQEVKDFFQYRHVVGFEIGIGQAGPGTSEICRQMLDPVRKILIQSHPDSTFQPFQEQPDLRLFLFPGGIR